MIEIEEGQDEWSITAREIRLRFRRAGDRWLHEIDCGPARGRPTPLQPSVWKPTVEAVDWRAEDGSAFGPVYQDVHLQRKGDAVIAFAVGQAGAHHYSATFRVSERTWYWNFVNEFQQEINSRYFASRIEVDVADRCLSQAGPVEVRYLVKRPPGVFVFRIPEEGNLPDYFSKDWQPSLRWNIALDSLFLKLEAEGTPPTSHMSVTDHDWARGWSARVAPLEIVPSGTTRFVYSWEHWRVKTQVPYQGGY